MAEADEYMFYDTLSELVYNDKKIVTYKGLSQLLGIHVNLAKQMLYTFYTKEKNKRKNIHALMYVSGIAVPKQPDESSDGGCAGASVIEKHSIVLCHDTDLLKTKSNYRKLFSVHVYALSAFPVTDYSALLQKSAIVEAGAINDNTTAANGPFKVHAPALSRQRVASAQEAIVKTETDQENKRTIDKTSASKKNGIMAAFAASKASSVKIIPKKEEPMEIEKKSVKLTSPPQEKKSQKLAQNGHSSTRDAKGSALKNKRKVADTTTRKRSRIIMQSDSDSDEEQHPASKRSGFESSDEEPSVPANFESEEDEAIPKNGSEAKSETVLEQKPVVNGKRKVAKVICNTFMDEDGYVVTKKETVMVSEEEEEEKQENPAKESAKIINKEMVAKKPIGEIRPKSNDILAKKKQSSIMSFFTKKN